MQTTPEQSRFFWSVLTLLTSLLLVGMVALLTSGCTTFKAAQRKFSTTVVDTVYNSVHVTVPRDSAVLRLVTDTTTVVHEIRQGRARIIYQRTPNETTVRAICDTVVIEKKVPQYISKQVWGVDPAWQKRAERRMVMIWILLGIILAGVLAYLFAYRLMLRVSISKR